MGRNTQSVCRSSRVVFYTSHGPSQLLSVLTCTANSAFLAGPWRVNAQKALGT